jgi:WD40 repeat protein/class 3 adenylate cyclase/energy-coupling factor transporter ATP-binding protein EcfA2
MATVTFFFADQAGSTVQLERLGDAGAKGVRQALIDMLRQAAEDHSGEVVDHTGDGLMITFASAVDAVACGVAVQQQAARHNGRHPEAEALGVRVGIHTGEPLVNDEGRYFGVPVVIAARLCAAADTAQILVSDVTRALVAPRRAHGFTPLGERALKGIAEPVPVAAVDWAPEETERPLPEVLTVAAAGPFVGRTAELAWLEGLWEQMAGAGGPARRRVALVAGDPGIGKTRLAAALAVAVEERGGLVLYGGCDEEPAGPYQPLVEALGPYVAAVPRAELRQQLGPAGGMLTRVLPELAERVPHLTGPARLEPETEPYLVAEAAEALLVAVARTTPTLLVLDDLHWADAATLLVVRQLARGTAPAPLLVLGCYREPDVGRSRVLAEAGVDPRRPGPVHHRRLTGLLTPEVAELLGTLTGETPSDTLVRTIDAETEGNPFFVHRLAGNLVERKLAQQVGRAARRAETTRLDLRGVREELVAGVLELQRLRDRPAPGQGPDAAGHAGLLMEAPVEPDGTPPVPTAVPYKGLVRFEAGDAGLFCGREQLVAQLVARLVAARFVAVVGPSGSGKSSLVRAGLLPTLAGGALPGSDTWEPLVLAPGPDPLRALADRLAPHLPGADPAALAARLQAGPDALALVAAEALAGRPDTARLLLVVDQFEEVFTACRDEAARRGFVDPLVAAATARESRCVVALALRADFYGRCTAHPELAAELADSQVLVGPMTDEELRRAVVEPARRVGCVVEPGLPETILEDVAAEPGALPLAPTPLLETWERRRGRSLTLTAYAETGGVRGAVARLADGVFDGFDQAEQAVARGVFLRLTEPGEGVDDLRRRAHREELGDDPVTDRVLGVLVARRLVIADQGTVEVAHEALLREWPRLRAWLEEDREGRRLHRQLGEAAADWVAHHRDPEQLYRGARLAAALDWARSHAPDLNQREREFLDAGRAHHERQLRRARRTTAVLAGLLVLALVAGGLALIQRSTARRQEVIARSTGLAAQASARRESEPDLALLLAVEGHRLDDSIQTRGGLLDTLGQSPQLAALHQGYGELTSVDLSPDETTLAARTVDGRLRLWDFRTRAPKTPPIDTGQDKGDVAFSPDGRFLATSGDDGSVRLWDAARGTPVGAVMRHRPGGAASVRFSPDGRRLASTGFEDGSARLWAVPSGAALARVRVDELGAQFATFSPDGRTLVVPTELAGDVALADVASGRVTGRLRLPNPDTGLGGATISPDGSTIAAGGLDGRIYLWDARTRKRRGDSLVGHENSVRSLAYSPDGSVLATAGEDGTGIMLWDVASGHRIGSPLLAHPGAESDVVRFIGDGAGLLTNAPTEVAVWDLDGVALGRRVTGAHQGRIYDLARTRDGRLLASAGQEDGTVRLWDVAARRPVGPPLKSGASTVTDLAFSPDGRLLAVGTLPDPPTPSQVQLWDVASRGRVAAFKSKGQTRPQFSPDGRTVAAHDGHGGVLLWDVAARRQRGKTIPADTVGEQNHVVAAFSPDSRTLVTGGRLGEIRFWDPATGAKLAEPLPTHADNVVDFAFSPDGAFVASASTDGNVLLWDVARRRVAGVPFTGGGGALSRVAFGPDGTVLATTDHNSNVHLWDVATRRQIGRPLTGHRLDAIGVTFVDGGDTLVTSSADGSLIFWDLRPASWEAKACQLAGRNLTRDEWDQFVGGDYRRTCPQWPGEAA